MSESIAMSIFTNNLRRVLTERRMSIQDLAELCGVRRSYLSRLLHGHHSPSIEIAEKIASACGVPLYEMFTPQSRKLSV